MRILSTFLVAILAVFSVSNSWALGVERYVEGVHYTRVDGAKPAPGKVVEFFSFGCPHCAHLEPVVEEWLKQKPAAAEFSRIPATWNPRFEFLGQVYYAMQALGVDEKLSEAMFDYLHKDHRPLQTEDDVLAFMVQHGVDKGAFQKAWNDKDVKQKLKTAGEALARYKVSGVPAFVVAGQYMTSVSQAGSENELFEVVDFLLNK